MKTTKLGSPQLGLTVLVSVGRLGIILMSSAALSNQKMCPPIPVPCQDVSLDMIDMSPANCHACHFKYFL